MVHRIEDYKRKEKSMLPYKEGENSIGSHCIAVPDSVHVLFHVDYRRAISKKWFFVDSWSRMCVCVFLEDTHIQCNAGRLAAILYMVLLDEPRGERNSTSYCMVYNNSTEEHI